MLVRQVYSRKAKVHRKTFLLSGNIQKRTENTVLILASKKQIYLLYTSAAGHLDSCFQNPFHAKVNEYFQTVNTFNEYFQCTEYTVILQETQNLSSNDLLFIFPKSCLCIH